MTGQHRVPPSDRAVLATAEVRRVAEQYALQWPISVQPLGLGSRANAKSRLVTQRGEFLLKRRPDHRSSPELVQFIHAFHRHLEARGVPVAPLVLTRSGQTAVQQDGHVYELFGWVPGGRWSRTAEEAASAGAAIGRMLRAAQGYAPPGRHQTASFHAHAVVAQALRDAPAAACAADPSTDRAALEAVCAQLAAHTAEASRKASVIEEQPKLVTHGDLHPGNLLYLGGTVQGILDFDSARMDWRSCELANAALHFGNDPLAGSQVGEWDPALQLDRVQALLAAAQQGMGAPLTPAERQALPWLMVEACVLESVVPVLRTGRFGPLRADQVLPFVQRKAAWLVEHAAQVQAAAG